LASLPDGLILALMRINITIEQLKLTLPLNLYGVGNAKPFFKLVDEIKSGETQIVFLYATLCNARGILSAARLHCR